MGTRAGSVGRAVVVGAGVAGAAAANRLHNEGFDVLVLEAEARIGGRTSTLEQEGFRIDLAASMLLQTYKRTAELIKEIGASDSFEPASDLMGVSRDGRIHHIRASQPLDAARTGLLSLGAKLRLARIAKDAVVHRKELDWADPVAAANLHYGDVRHYADTRVRNTEVRDHLIDPACRFLCLSSLEDVSAVDFLFLARNMGKTAFFNSPEGIDTLARLLTKNVQVETSATVTSVEEHGNEVTVSWERPGEKAHRAVADVCVIAVPAPSMAQIYPQMGRARRDILASVVYAPALNVYLGVDQPPADPSALILVPQTDDPDLACLILDHNKTSGRVPPGAGLISSFWHRDWAEKHWDDDDTAILAAALPGIDALLPGVSENIRTVHIQRWRNALISGPTSRYRDLERFRALTPGDSRVRFAGDAMSASTINSCVCSGERAADELINIAGTNSGRIVRTDGLRN